MSNLVLVTGGSRSGKSAYALKRALALPVPRAFVATCPVLDDEMRERVRRHQLERQNLKFETLEEPVNLVGAIKRAAACKVILIDCLTLWVNNLLYAEEQAGRALEEDDLAIRCQNVIKACRRNPGTVLLVTNEVGMGIIPDNPLARRFRDLAGLCNSTFAAAADEVWLCVSGILLKVK